MVLLACLLLLVALGATERLASARARAAVPIRIHVNGTRAKSSVTRLIAGALREAGIQTLAKVTGTEPRLILPDGSERAVARRAPASIREQAWLIRCAARDRVRAVVVECMAVRPDLQWTSEREMVQATIGVITNARLDHIEVMGRTREEVVLSLANTIPRRGVLVVGDEAVGAAVAPQCEAAGTRLVIGRVGQLGQARQVWQAGSLSADTAATREPNTGWMRENVAIALAVTRELGIEDRVALRGMEKAAADPGAVRHGTATIAGRAVEWIDATAANDPDSLDLVVTALNPSAAPSDASARESAVGQGFSLAGHLSVYNHRADRPVRLLTFAESSEVFRGSAAILVTGDRPPLSLVRRIRRLCPAAFLRFVTARDLEAAIHDAVARAEGEVVIVCCGNTRGWIRPFALARSMTNDQ